VIRAPKAGLKHGANALVREGPMVVEAARQNSGAHLVKKLDFLPRIAFRRGIAAVQGFGCHGQRRFANPAGSRPLDARAVRARSGAPTSTHD
jgi:hypothetical protein